MNFHQISFIYITKYFIIQLTITGLPTLHEADFSQKKYFLKVYKIYSIAYLVDEKILCKRIHFTSIFFTILE